MTAAGSTITLGPYWVGEKPEPIVLTFTTVDGATPVNLTGYTVQMVYAANGQPSVTESCTLVAAALGQAQYTPSTTWCATAGKVEAVMWAGNSVNRYGSARIQFTVAAPPGTAPAI